MTNDNAAKIAEVLSYEMRIDAADILEDLNNPEDAVNGRVVETREEWDAIKNKLNSFSGARLERNGLSYIKGTAQEQKGDERRTWFIFENVDGWTIIFDAA